jgi:uncharacterized membrane protein YphA (DoxX/SURF4 family)
LIAYACRLVVGAVLLVSGTLKLRDRRWPAAARELGTPSFLVPLLPPAEIVLGALLITGLGGRWAAFVALGLLIVFTAAIVVQLARGRQVPCACFGQFSTRPVDMVAVARNLALCGLALAGAVIH